MMFASEEGFGCGPLPRSSLEVKMDLTNIDTLRALLSRHEFHFAKSLGQNFLIRSWVPERIMSVAGIESDTGVLEIGPGIGVLTRCLSQSASKVAAVELDRRLLPVLSETLADCPNVHVINEDIMKTDLDLLVKNEFSGLRPVVCANLPYQITTPVLSRLLECGLFHRITVMIQKEVAQRVCAKAGSPEYGAFSLFVQYYADAVICFDVPPDCFQPRPKVTSSVICLVRKEPPAELQDEKLFFALIKAAFAQRRKTLVNALTPLLSPGMSKEQIQDVIVLSCGLSPMIRGEALNQEDFIRISNTISTMQKSSR